MKNYLLIFSLFALFAFSSKPRSVIREKAAPFFTVLKFDKKEQLFKDSIKGTIINGLSWKDSKGEHRALFTAIPVKMNESSGLQSGAIYVYCFSKNTSGWKKTWEVKDRVDACEVDATCEFFPKSFTITDRDANDVGEVTFLYKLSCKGDVSPDDKKLIMYEGVNKYAIRGATILQFAEGKEGGDKKIDPSFTKAAKPLLDFANSQWDKFGTTKY
jgi:hypothetical protein